MASYNGVGHHIIPSLGKLVVHFPGLHRGIILARSVTMSVYWLWEAVDVCRCYILFHVPSWKESLIIIRAEADCCFVGVTHISSDTSCDFITIGIIGLVNVNLGIFCGPFVIHTSVLIGLASVIKDAYNWWWCCNFWHVLGIEYEMIKWEGIMKL